MTHLTKTNQILGITTPRIIGGTKLSYFDKLKGLYENNSIYVQAHKTSIYPFNLKQHCRHAFEISLNVR